MADIKINISGCDDDDDNDCKRGKRGKRGHRGHDGPAGPEGPAGESIVAGSLLKFSGVVAPAVEGFGESFLEDWGVGLGSAAIISLAPSYPVAVAHDIVNMSTNLLLGLAVPLGNIVIELLKNGVLVPGFTTTYVSGDSGIRNITAGPEPFAVGDTFDIRITTTGIVGNGHSVSATLGLE